MYCGGVLSCLNEVHTLINSLEEPVSEDIKEGVLYNDMKPWEVPEYIIGAINRKRVCPTIKGDALHKFKNEFNTLKQILHLLYNYDSPIHYRLALHWASWGAQNFQGYFDMKDDEKAKMDIKEVPVSEDLEEAAEKYYPILRDDKGDYLLEGYDVFSTDIEDSCKIFKEYIED